MWANKYWLSNHHRVAKYKNDEWFKVHDKLNQGLIKHTEHRLIHTLLGNSTPQEQLIYFFTLNEKVMSREAKEIMKYLEWMNREEFYLDRLLK